MTTPACLQGGGNQKMLLNGAGQSERSVGLYPNPNRGDQLFVNLTGIDASVETVSVDIYDAFGKRVSARTIAVNGEGFVNTVLDVNDLANGMYMVSFGAGSSTFSERLVIQK
ncbi:MAG: T9SS type A sorting domain-containing protein [Flavobacteriales bacterium]|nr:T9SS type A sorting domain-containing protein [Flavobacteriales bacterium]